MSDAAQVIELQISYRADFLLIKPSMHADRFSLAAHRNARVSVAMAIESPEPQKAARIRIGGRTSHEVLGALGVGHCNVTPHSGLR
jgi:hypothetical protein